MNTHLKDREDHFHTLILLGSLLIIFTNLCQAVHANTANKIRINNPNERIQAIEKANEKIQLNVNVYGFHVGTMMFKSGSQNSNEKKLHFNVKSGGLANWFGTRKGTFTTYLDNTFWPNEYTYNIFLNGTRSEAVRVRYNRGTQTFFRQQLHKKTADTRSFTESGAIDALSALHLMRTLPPKSETTFVYTVHSEDSFFDFPVTVLGTEIVSTHTGKQHAIKVKPDIPEDYAFDRLIKQGTTFWFSADQRRIPLKMTVPTDWLNVYVYIKKYKSTHNPMELIDSI